MQRHTKLATGTIGFLALLTLGACEDDANMQVLNDDTRPVIQDRMDQDELAVVDRGAYRGETEIRRLDNQEALRYYPGDAGDVLRAQARGGGDIYAQPEERLDITDEAAADWPAGDVWTDDLDAADREAFRTGRDYQPSRPMRGGDATGTQGAADDAARGTQGAIEAGTPRDIRMIAANYDFDPSTITVRPGQTVEITLVNNGDAPHSIDVEMPQGEAVLEQPVAPGQSQTLTFTAPEQPGRYVFYCPIADHRERGMEGHLIVEAEE